MEGREHLEQGREQSEFMSALHHRLKNNLQTVASVISVQASRATDPKVATALRTVQNRVRAIAGVLGTESTDDLAMVHFGNYLKSLMYDLAAEYSVRDGIAMKVESADIAVEVDHAIALALIANELAANALEHAFPENGSGEINVKLSYGAQADGGPEEGILEISDSGVPLANGWDGKEAEKTGLFLVRTLTAQLHAKFSVEEKTAGKTFRLEFPMGA